MSTSKLSRGFILLGLILMVTLSWTGQARAQEDGCAPGVVLVKFRAGADPVLVKRIVQRHGLLLNRVLPRIGVQRFRIPTGQREILIARLIASYPQVEYAEPDYIRYARYTPSDPLFPHQWDMTKMRLPEVWEINRGSASIVVAVLDTGIDLTHPDLYGSLWVNTDEIAGNNIDDDGNGYIDDRNGFDFAGDGVFPFENAQDPIPNDTDGHGTHVSGTIAAQMNNSRGITGVAPLTKVMPVRVLGGFLGSGYSSDIINGITYAVDNGAKVINMSLGGTSKSLAEFNALKYAWDRNVTVVAAAGNSGDSGNPIEYPAGYPFTISVGATDINDNIAGFSTHNAFVEVSAPGVDILSTVPGSYEQTDWSGTSMATPHVAGLAALLHARHPGIANWEVRAILQSSSIGLGAAGWDEFFGYGRVDAQNAVGTVRPRVDQLNILTPAPSCIHPAGAITAALWNPVANAVSYRLKATMPSGALKTIPVNATYYVVHPATLMPAGRYTIVVEALNGNGVVIASDSVVFRKTN